MKNNNKKSCIGCFRILADDTRVRIVKILQEGEGKNVNAITKTLDRSQPTVSHHLKVLSNAGFVRHERKGKEVVYTFNADYSCKGCGVFTVPIKI